MTAPTKGHCEAMLTRWGETSTGGMTVTFTLDSNDFPAGHPFKGMPVGKGGERLMVAWQVIGADEQPIEPMPEPLTNAPFDFATFEPGRHKKFDQMSIGQQVALLCNDEVFWRFIEQRFALDDGYVTGNIDAKDQLCEWYGVISRRDIPADEWSTLYQEFKQFRREA